MVALLFMAVQAVAWGDIETIYLWLAVIVDVTLLVASLLYKRTATGGDLVKEVIMSTKALIEELQKEKGSAGNSMQRLIKQLEKRAQKEDALERLMPNLFKAMQDLDRVMLDLRVKIRDDGTYIALLKRDNELTEEVVFSVGDEAILAFMGLDKRIGKDVWKPSLPWNPEADKQNEN